MAECRMIYRETGIYAEFSLHSLAKLAGLESYDCAIPQQWVDEVITLTTLNPIGNFVWCYDDVGFPKYSTIFGYPVALTQQGFRILELLDNYRK